MDILHDAMTLDQLNQLSVQDLKMQLLKCCGSSAWASGLAKTFPHQSLAELKNASDRIWSNCNEKDFLEAFSHHPKIGDVESLRKKFVSTVAWASGEQSQVQQAGEDVLMELKNLNELYEKRFGFIFIVFATGKSAGEMLASLKARLNNTREEELRLAANEQNKITHLRLEKLMA